MRGRRQETVRIYGSVYGSVSDLNVNLIGAHGSKRRPRQGKGGGFR